MLAVAGAAASAQTAASAPGANTPRVDQRQANQEQRIDQGIASGALTKRETRRLEKEQTVINKAEDKAKADGTVTARSASACTRCRTTPAATSTARSTTSRRPSAPASTPAAHVRRAALA